MNEILFFLTIIITLSLVIISYKLFSKNGLYAWIALATIIANIEVSKCIDMFGLSVTLGNVIYGSVFLATDLISEIYGGKEARKAVYVGLFAMIVFTILSQISLVYIPNEEDTVSYLMELLYGFMPRICISSMVSYLISNILDTYIFDWIKNKFPKHLWLRNNGSTMISQLIDSILFNALAFMGVFTYKTLIEIIITTYILKLIIAICDTPFIYLAKRLNIKE